MKEENDKVYIFDIGKPTIITKNSIPTREANWREPNNEDYKKLYLKMEILNKRNVFLTKALENLSKISINDLSDIAVSFANEGYINMEDLYIVLNRIEPQMIKPRYKKEFDRVLEVVDRVYFKNFDFYMKMKVDKEKFDELDKESGE